MNAETLAALERAAKLCEYHAIDWGVATGQNTVEDAVLIRALIERERAGGERAAIVRIDPAEYQDGLYLNPVTGAVMRVEKPGGERAAVVAGNRMELNDDGTLDEIVTDGAAHLEHLQGKQWFLNCLRADGSSVAVWITGKVTSWEERDVPKRLPFPKAGAHMAGAGEEG